MRKPVNSEIDLIRSIYSRSSELILEVKAKKLTPKDPDLFSGVPAPVAPPVAAPVVKGKGKGKAKTTKNKPVVEAEPQPETTVTQVDIDPMTKKQGTAIFGKPKTPVSSGISSVPTLAFGEPGEIINPGFRINPKRLSSVLTASDIINRQQPLGSTISTANTQYGNSNPGDLDKDGSVTPSEMRFATSVVPPTPSTSSTAYKLGQNAKNIFSPKIVIPALLAGSILTASLFNPKTTKIVNPPTQSTPSIQSTPSTQSTEFEAPPDPGQRRWTPIREQQEITEYYRQALVQRLEEASAAFWTGRAGATRQEVEDAEASERFNILAPFKAMEPNKYPVKNMPVKKKKEVESVPLKREDRFQFPNDPVTQREFTLSRLSTPDSAPSGPRVQQALIPSGILDGLEGRMKGAELWARGVMGPEGQEGETTQTTLPGGEVKQVRLGAPLPLSDRIAATEIKKRLMAMQTRRAQPTTQPPKETFDAEGVDMTVELPRFPKISTSRQAQIGAHLERELSREHGSVSLPKAHAGDDIDDDTAIDTELPEVRELGSIGSHAKREDASNSTAVRNLEKLYPASSRVSEVGVISTEGAPLTRAQSRIDARAARQRRSHAALHNIYGNLFNQHSGSATRPDQLEPDFAGGRNARNAEPVSTGRTDVSLTTSWPQLVAQELSPHKYSVVNPITKETKKIPVITPFKDEYTSTGKLRKTPLHPVRQALNQVRLSEPHTFAALLPHVDEGTRASLQQHMDYLAKNSARNVETPVNNAATLLKNISRF